MALPELLSKWVIFVNCHCVRTLFNEWHRRRLAFQMIPFETFGDSRCSKMFETGWSCGGRSGVHLDSSATNRLWIGSVKLEFPLNFHTTQKEFEVIRFICPQDVTVSGARCLRSSESSLERFSGHSHRSGRRPIEMAFELHSLWMIRSLKQFVSKNFIRRNAIYSAWDQLFDIKQFNSNVRT